MEKVIITVVGKDTTGIIARVCTSLAEDEINATRNILREKGIGQIESRTGNYQSINYFLDIIAELEAMGDFMINVSQALLKK